MKIVEGVMMGVLSLAGPLFGWDRPAKQYALLREDAAALY